MSFTPGMSEFEGEFTAAKEVTEQCRHCDSTTMLYEKWEASCGGWEDVKVTCPKCRRVYWIEGIDA